MKGIDARAQINHTQLLQGLSVSPQREGGDAAELPNCPSTALEALWGLRLPASRDLGCRTVTVSPLTRLLLSAQMPKAGKGMSWCRAELSAGASVSVLPPCRCTGVQAHLGWAGSGSAPPCSSPGGLSRVQPRACSKSNNANSFCRACRDPTSRKKRIHTFFSVFFTHGTICFSRDKEGRKKLIHYTIPRISLLLLCVC